MLFSELALRKRRAVMSCMSLVLSYLFLEMLVPLCLLIVLFHLIVTFQTCLCCVFLAEDCVA